MMVNRVTLQAATSVILPGPAESIQRVDRHTDESRRPVGCEPDGFNST